MTTASSDIFSTETLDVARIRADFPIFGAAAQQWRSEDQRLVYLDSANTSQKPSQVLDAMNTFAATAYGPINRSAYRLAAEATDAF
ncbi:MAG TPA: aminotransferase class V-fold PLP-dependent enzyme, partial [Ilumatobacteraceae bacterium]|nr:aminotransferase class V-fold PLP-dependent enzyme [Ilumatobacteraceae bacterium]